MYRISLPPAQNPKNQVTTNHTNPMLGAVIQRVKDWISPADALKTIQTVTVPVAHTAATVSTTLTPQQAAGAGRTPVLRVSKLIMVTAENNNKYYEMREQADGTFTVEYGRIGGTKAVATYPVHQWDKKFREKVAKGYVDQTHLFAVQGPSTDASSIKDEAVRGLISRLMELANRSISQNYVVTADQVTRKQVERAQEILDELASMLKQDLDPQEFNARLIELFKIIPRKMGKVNDHLLKIKPTDPDALRQLHNQVAGEQDTLDVMRGQVELNEQQAGPDEAPKDLLAGMNLTVAPVTDDRVITLIKRMMGTDADKFDAAFSVRQELTQTAFDAHISQSHNPKTQLLWHGSRSENWMSILKSGLVLRPANAVINGKMFGHGIYFADQFSKSLNYTSLHGATWARGNQREGYLAIYEVHVGEQLELTQHEGWHMSLNQEVLHKINRRYDSVFARRGISLLKNEYIVYTQAQCTVRYMVRIKI